MTKLNASDVRKDFSEALNRVAFGRERIVLERHGKKIAALVPIEDLEAIEAASTAPRPGRRPAFMKYAGIVHGRERDLSTRKGFSTK